MHINIYYLFDMKYGINKWHNLKICNVMTQFGVLWFDAYINFVKERQKDDAQNKAINNKEISFKTDDDDTSMIIIYWDYRNSLLSSLHWMWQWMSAHL